MIQILILLGAFGAAVLVWKAVFSVMNAPESDWSWYDNE